MPDGRRQPLQLEADLRIELTSADGDVTAHLHNEVGRDELVLDVNRPVALLGQIRRSEFPWGALRQLRSRVELDAVIQVRSQDRLLARLRLAPGGRIRWRPARGGLLLAPQMAFADPRGRLAILGGFVLAVLIGSDRLRRRSHSSS